MNKILFSLLHANTVAYCRCECVCTLGGRSFCNGDTFQCAHLLHVTRPIDSTSYFYCPVPCAHRIFSAIRFISRLLSLARTVFYFYGKNTLSFSVLNDAQSISKYQKRANYSHCVRVRVCTCMFDYTPRYALPR